MASFFADIGNSLIQAATGSTTAELQAEATAAEQALEVAIGVMVGLELVIAIELFLLVVMSFKERH